MSALRREGIQFIREGTPKRATTGLLRTAEYFYVMNLDLFGTNPLHHSKLRPLKAALKVWAEACLLVGEEGGIKHARDILVDLAETDAIIEAYQAAVLEETRREAREARAAAASGAAAMAGGGSTGKSKAAKREQQKRKARQLKKRAAEAAAAAAEGSSRDDQDDAEKVEEGEAASVQQQQQQQQGDLAAATLGLTLQDEAEEAEGGEKTKEEEEEEEECSVCLCVFLESDDRDCRLVCKHVYHTSCLALWQANCVRKAIEPTCPYCRAPLHFEKDS